MNENLKEEAINVKRYMMATGQVPIIREKDLEKTPVKIAASLDGSWKSRGWNSKDGIVDVGFDGTGKMLDVIVKRATCNTCRELKDKKEKGELSDFQCLEACVNHEESCEKNHDGSASAMEPEGALALFQRSVEKLNLIYKTYVGDGDSASFSRVSNEYPYGPNESIQKEECISKNA